MTTPTKQHDSDANRQTSERERLAEWLESAGKGILTSEIARQLRAGEAEIESWRVAATINDLEVKRLRAENEALRTVTDEDVIRTSARTGVMPVDVRKALQSFIRSKES